MESTNFEVKPAIVIVKAGVDYEKATQLIEQADGLVRKAIDLANV